MSWLDASENFKKNLKNRLGDIAYREFLRHVTNDCSLDVINDWWRWSMLTHEKNIHQELFRMVSDYDPVTWSDEPRSSKATTEAKAEAETETPAFVDDNLLYFAQELAGIYDDGFSFNYDNPTADLSEKDHFSENLLSFTKSADADCTSSLRNCVNEHNESSTDEQSCDEESPVIYLQITQSPVYTYDFLYTIEELKWDIFILQGSGKGRKHPKDAE
jgi:hypothetical protein